MTLDKLFNEINLEYITDEKMLVLLKNREEELSSSAKYMISNMSFYYFCLKLLKFSHINKHNQG